MEGEEGMSEPDKLLTPLTKEQYFRLLEQIKDAEDNLNTARRMIVRTQNKLFIMKNTILMLDPEYKKLKEEE